MTVGRNQRFRWYDHPLVWMLYIRHLTVWLGSLCRDSLEHGIVRLCKDADIRPSTEAKYLRFPFSSSCSCISYLSDTPWKVIRLMDTVDVPGNLHEYKVFLDECTMKWPKNHESLSIIADFYSLIIINFTLNVSFMHGFTILVWMAVIGS